jgi:hypothetical protein
MDRRPALRVDSQRYRAGAVTLDAKVIDATPIERVGKPWARHGYDIAPSTMHDWFGRGASEVTFLGPNAQGVAEGSAEFHAACCCARRSSASTTRRSVDREAKDVSTDVRLFLRRARSVTPRAQLTEAVARPEPVADAMSPLRERARNGHRLQRRRRGPARLLPTSDGKTWRERVLRARRASHLEQRQKATLSLAQEDPLARQ